MRYKEFKEAAIDDTIAQTKTPNAAMADTSPQGAEIAKAQGPGVLSKIGGAIKSVAQAAPGVLATAGSRAAYGFNAGFNSGLGPGKDPITAPGAAVRADAAALEPFKYAWNLYSGQMTPAQLPNDQYNKVHKILTNIPADWAAHKQAGTVPDALRDVVSKSNTHNVNQPPNPQIVNYIKSVLNGQKIQPTNNQELNKLLKAAGAL